MADYYSILWLDCILFFCSLLNGHWVISTFRRCEWYVLFLLIWFSWEALYSDQLSAFLQVGSLESKRKQSQLWLGGWGPMG